MNINIFGSTGNIGTKTLSIIKNNFPFIQVNLLLANKNYKKLLTQVKLFKPKYVCLNDNTKLPLLKNKLVNYRTKIILSCDINEYLYKSKTELTILSISGYNSLNYLEAILFNTNNLGLVSKECIVSAGHLLKKFSKKNNTKIFPLDSEHYSLNYLFSNKNFQYNNVYLTASGGPFLTYNLKSLEKITFKQAIKHPKWKMGYKNSIDSSTLANKCLELVEAHYLFDIPYEKLKIIIHPEAVIHSIVDCKNLTSIMNYFYPDMFIPIYNFLNSTNNIDNEYLNKKFEFNQTNQLNFYKVDKNKFPLFNVFDQIDKNSKIDVIKFNCSNEIAVNLFKFNKIKYNQIHQFIDNSLSLDFNNQVNSINDIVEFQQYFKEIVLQKNEII